jgi:hypothetical protein
MPLPRCPSHGEGIGLGDDVPPRHDEESRVAGGEQRVEIDQPVQSLETPEIDLETEDPSGISRRRKVGDVTEQVARRLSFGVFADIKLVEILRRLPADSAAAQQLGKVRAPATARYE